MKTPKRILVLAAILLAAGAAYAAGPPVTVTMAVTGDPTPGATVTAKATVVINDGSTLLGVKWSQTGGIAATLTNTATDTVTIALPSRKAFREELMEVLEEPPIADSQLPSYVPAKVPYESGLQNRFGIVGVSPHARTDSATVTLDIEVTTTSGTYHTTGLVAGNVPWETSAGTRNVPILLPVLLHAKTQTSYDWKLTAPAGSNATLLDATTQNPEFTPDITGTYELTVTDVATTKPVKLTIHAGKWTGVITALDENGYPKATECMTCHVKNTPHFDMFTPWSKSGHAEVFKQNVTTPNGHYTTACLSCHTVGFNAQAVKNGGIDDATDWTAFLGTDLLTHGATDNWTKIVAQFPATAKMANIQCENCHGPQDSPAHMKKDGSRKTLSSDTCGSCHGEPLRHGRFQQWQLSKHANYETAVAEGTNASCAKCHSAQGFVAWQNSNFSATTDPPVTWTADEVHPQTCATCHDPHDVGSTSGGPTTNAKVRITGNTPMLMSGFVANSVGSGAICMTCHNGRRGLRNDSNFAIADATRAPHSGPQADVLMGQNMYFAKTGTRSFHSMIQDSCVACHMESTDPPAALANKNADGTFGGTNHTFFASNTICTKCHSSINLASVQAPVQSKMDALKAQLETAIKGVMQSQIRAGNTIDLNGQKTIKNASDIQAVEFIESHGRQGVNVTLTGGVKVSDLSLATVKVARPAGGSVELYSVADPAIGKAGWNLLMTESDGSKGVHNPGFVNAALDVSLFAVTAANNALLAPTNPSVNPAAIGGGLGNGAGAVSCTTAYVYWTEYVGRTPGAAGSLWRTDLVARNLESSTANLRFILHQPSGNLEKTGTIIGNSQKAFEDLTATLGETNSGALEICSDRPLLVMSRVFNQGDVGTFGQSLDGRVADLGYSAGQTVSLIGLRQKDDAYRTNLVVANGGKTEAQVAIILFDATGQSLGAFNVTVPAGTSVMDTEPFKNRVNAPNVDWGFATVTVLKGTNVITSASMIDMKTNDPTTIPAKQ